MVFDGPIPDRSGTTLRHSPSSLAPPNADCADLAGSGRPANGDHAPNRFHDTEGPGATREAVGTREGAPEGEEDDETTAPVLERVHRHHEGERDDAVDRDEVHRSPQGTGARNR